MAKRPYFAITKDSFEKNSGYKSTVHALAELIDNSFEAQAERVVIVMQVDPKSQLQKIAVIDDGKGMDGNLLQMAVCEKAGSYLDRQRSGGGDARRKLGKYGVGLPKASISQCNKFTVWSWVAGGIQTAKRNGTDITDEDWIMAGAEIDESTSEQPPLNWLKVAGMDSVEHGTMILWDDLDGLTWSRARWGKYSGLIPNLEFEVGRVYRKLLNDESATLSIDTIVVNNSFRVFESNTLKSNDPLYLIQGQDVPRKVFDNGDVWPPDDPLFDLFGEHHMNIEVPLKNGDLEEIVVKWRCSLARKNVFAKLNGATAGSLPHGKHAMRNVGLSLLREEREISMSMALASPSEPRERWFGVEVEFPHELDAILGMTNNKQEYTRLERVLQHHPSEYMEDGETSSECLRRIEKEDNDLAICLRIAWKTQDVWNNTKKSHLNFREDHNKVVSGADGEIDIEEDGTAVDPEGKAEEVASGADPRDESKPAISPEETDSLKAEYESELNKAGVPSNEAKQIAARIVDRGLSYAIAYRSGLGSPFFNAREIKGVKLIELNTDHLAHKYIKSSIEEIESDDIEELKKKIETSKIAIHLILEAWAKNEIEALIDSEKRMLHRIREDWGRHLESFIEELEKGHKIN